MANRKSQIDLDVEDYQDPAQITPKSLKLGLWLIDNHQNIFVGFVIFLSSLSLIFFAYSAYVYTIYFLHASQSTDISATATAAILQDYHQHNQPLNLISGPVSVFTDGANYDLAVKVTNPNPKHYATFQFCFTTVSDQVCQDAFVLPNEEKYLTVINQPLKDAAIGVSFKPATISWRLLNAHTIPDWAAYKAERENFNISNPQFNSYDGNNYLEFTVTNNSAYGYYEVPLTIMLQNYSGLSAVSRYSLTNLKSGASQDVRLLWGSGSGDTVSIYPDVNIIDPTVFMPYTAD
jgi:hypothetical protein